jgi:glycosyltransferase involved in cell wall biosynthesis
LRVSVVIPAYQAARYVRQAIHSVLTQDVQPAEIIVVDDGSTDDTADIARQVSADITVIRKANGGEASARNTGLRAATADWVAYLDADDRFLRGRLRAVAALSEGDPELDVITADGYLEIAGQVVGTCYSAQWTFPTSDHRREILRRNFVLGHVVARRARLIDLGGFDESITHTTDWDMWIRLVMAGGRLGFVDQRLSVYRLHASSLSANRVGMARGALATLESAAANVALSVEEQAVVRETIAMQRSLIERERLSSALAAGSLADARAAASSVTRDTTQSARSRTLALATAVIPGATSAVVRHRRKSFGVGATGRYVPLDADAGRFPADAARNASDGECPMVSVILPFLDEERFLAGAIATVRAQTMESWELLLVDDGSSDQSVAIAERAAHDDLDRIRVLRHPGGRNCGLAASRNLGLEHARAGAIAFLDADDRWEPGTLDRQLHRLATHPDAAMVCGPTWHRDVGGETRDVLWPVTSRAPKLYAPGEFAREIARETVTMPPPPSAVMYRTSALRGVGGVPAGDNLYEDQRTFVAVNLHYPIHVDNDDPVSIYTKRPDSLFGSLAHDPFTKTKQRRRFEWWLIRRGMRSGFAGATTVVALVLHRLHVSVGRRLRRVTDRLGHAAAPRRDSAH